MRRIQGSGVLAVAIALTACGGAEEPLTVSAAASLSEPFAAYGERLEGEERFSFAGSEELAAQIRQGARPDLFASASTVHPERLHAEGLVTEPVVFARNRLVIAVAPESGIESISDLGEPGVDLVIGADGVPAGDYAREALAGLGPGLEGAVLTNVRSRESDVKGVVAKVAQDAADAGFVYSSDVAATSGAVLAVELPPRVAPRISYAIAVVEGTAEPGRARRFIDGLLGGEGHAALEESGLIPVRGH